jgi:transposase
MMGYGPPPNDPLFSYKVQLETRVRKDHPLRKIAELVDFDFIYREVEKTYGTNGNVSVPPPVVLKLMLLLVLYNVRSERELMETLPERLDWLWFLGLTIESPIPDHSVLSKARRRWGQDAFKRFFERIVSQCVEEGLVDGTKVFVDSSFIDANASNNSVVKKDSLTRYLREGYEEFERRLGDEATGVNSRYVSRTDPDASIVAQGTKPKLTYKTHRTVDVACEIITAVEVTPGAVNEAHRMLPLINQHDTVTGACAKTVVADSKYGTIENYLACHQRGVAAHIPLLKKTHEGKGRKKGIFSEDAFTYDPATDTMVCPAGKRLKKRTFHVRKESTEYIGSKKECGACRLRPRCTRNPLGRSVHRHRFKETLDAMLRELRSHAARVDIAIRKHLMERSFARSTRYGFDRARWRGLWKVAIQEYLVSAIQNIETLIRYRRKPTKGVRTTPFTTPGTVVRVHITPYLSFRWNRMMMSGSMALGRS